MRLTSRPFNATGACTSPSREHRSDRTEWRRRRGPATPTRYCPTLERSHNVLVKLKLRLHRTTSRAELAVLSVSRQPIDAIHFTSAEQVSIERGSTNVFVVH